MPEINDALTTKSYGHAAGHENDQNVFFFLQRNNGMEFERCVGNLSRKAGARKIIKGAISGHLYLIMMESRHPWEEGVEETGRMTDE